MSYLVLPDEMSLPDKNIPILGCVWCGLGGHDTVVKPICVGTQVCI